MSILRLKDFLGELYELIQFLEPQDVLCLSYTCQTLQSLLSTKDVWAAVLCSVCKEHMLFSPSYPIDEMNLSQIKYAAFGPYRWSRAVERYQMAHRYSEIWSRPMLERVHRSVIPSKIPSAYAKELFLVPGGRFLVIADHVGLEVVDLGVPGLPPLTSPHVVSKVDLTEYWGGFTLCSMAVQETQAGKLRAALVATNDSLVGVKAYDFFLSEPNAYWEQIGHLRIAMDYCFPWSSFQLDEDRLLMPLYPFQKTALIMIWNFVEGTYALWNRSDDLDQAGVVFLNDVVVCFSNAGIWSWPVESWSTLPSGSPILFEQLSIIERPFNFTFQSFPFSTLPMVTRLRPSNWYLKPGLPFLFDIVVSSGPKVVGYRFQVDLDASTSPSAKPSLLCMFSLPGGPKSWSPSRETGRLKFGFSPASMINLNDYGRISKTFLYSILWPHILKKSDEGMRPHEANADSSATPSSGVYLTRVHDDGPLHGLCTSSGRMASIKVTENRKGYYLSVDDYMSYHPSALDSA